MELESLDVGDEFLDGGVRVDDHGIRETDVAGRAGGDVTTMSLVVDTLDQPAHGEGRGPVRLEVGRPEGPERIQIERIRELDFEELEEEEVDSDDGDLQSEEFGGHGRGDGGAGARGGFTFDTSLACLHTYLGEVDDIANPRSFLEGGALLTLPMFYLEGIVLFPEDTLPLRVLQPRFKAAVERAIHQSEAPCTLGVIHVRARLRRGGQHLASVGTTAEIRQLRRLNDGSMNVMTRGRQRFRVLKAWTEADSSPCAVVQIIEEDRPLHIPRDAFGKLACVPSLQSGKVPRACQGAVELSEDEALQQVSSDFEDDYSDSADEDRMAGGAYGQFVTDGELLLGGGDRGAGEEGSSDEEERLRWWWRVRRGDVRRPLARRRAGVVRGEDRSEPEVESNGETSNQGEASVTANGGGVITAGTVKRPRLDGAWGGPCRSWAADESKWMYRAQLSTWPHWVYRMFDAYDLARRAADMSRQMAELPRMEEMVRNPAALSFYIASNMPLQDATRQELLEIDGVVHRLRREIQLLESMDRLRCKACSAVIARRSQMVVMSADGPISAYVNDHGYVHETLTLSRARGLLLRGRPDTANSWFPGYAWTIAHCRCCELHMGWRFTAVKEDMQPRAFWGVRRSQLADNTS